MNNRSEIRDFLTSRRAKVTPERAGLPSYRGHRRVSGLRREEVALLAGVSVDYYTRLERGNLSGVSEGVLEALVRALQLDEAERTHLFDLARAANATPGAIRRRRRPTSQLRPAVQRLLGRAVFAPLFATAAPTPNIARFIFLDPASQEFYRDWESLAGDTVALLRAQAGRDPYDWALTDLIGGVVHPQ